MKIEAKLADHKMSMKKLKTEIEIDVILKIYIENLKQLKELFYWL